MPVALTVTAPTTVASIQKKTYGSGTTTLIMSIEEIKYIMEIVRYHEES